MSVFVIDVEHALVLGIIAEGEAGFGGWAFIRTRPVPIGARATEDSALMKVLSLCRDAGLAVRLPNIVTASVDADVTVSPRTWRPVAAGGKRSR